MVPIWMEIGLCSVLRPSIMSTYEPANNFYATLTFL
jgi:hypothetical protein